MAHDTSPFAFPQTPAVSPSGDVYDPSGRYGGGMTLRDYFAGLALPGIAFDCGLEHSEAAERCYSFADAMVAEREKGQSAVYAAAPELLDALRAAEEFMAGFEGDEIQDGIDERLSGIRAAIAKAEGR